MDEVGTSGDSEKPLPRGSRIPKGDDVDMAVDMRKADGWERSTAGGGSQAL